MGRRERRCKQLLDNLKEKQGYWKLKEAPDHTLWRTLFSKSYRPVRRQLQNEWMNEWQLLWDFPPYAGFHSKNSLVILYCTLTNGDRKLYSIITIKRACGEQYLHSQTTKDNSCLLHTAYKSQLYEHTEMTQMYRQTLWYDWRSVTHATSHQGIVLVFDLQLSSLYSHKLL
jgi:hypothetical protein